jgi:hypothetical protein
MEIKEEYKKLIEKVLQYDNYDDIKSIIELGLMTREVMVDYKMRNDTNGIKIHEKIIYEDKIKELEEKIIKIREKYEDTIENVNNKLKKENEEEISNYRTKLLEKEENIIKICEKYEDTIEKVNDKLKKEKEEEISNYRTKLLEKEENIEKINNELLKIKNESFEKLITITEENRELMLKQQEQLEQKLNILKEEKNKEIIYFKEIIEKNEEKYNAILEKELNKIENEKNIEIMKLKKENEKYREKYEKLEINSVLKGKPYEEAVELELNELFEKDSNIFSIKKCSNQKGKGDYVIINNYSGIRIMLELKNMPKVSSTIKDQQPKFYNDIKDKTNNYDGGIMVSFGKIEGKKNYGIETYDNNKIVSFVENYTLNNPDKIHLILEIVHQKIQEIKTEKGLSEKKVLDFQVELYNSANENFKKIKSSYENQNNLIVKIKNNILSTFGIDVDEYILEKKNNCESLSKTIVEQVEDYIKKLVGENIMNETELKNEVMKKYEEYIELYKKDKKNGISKQKISNIVKKYIVENEKNIIINY